MALIDVPENTPCVVCGISDACFTSLVRASDEAMCLYCAFWSDLGAWLDAPNAEEERSE